MSDSIQNLIELLQSLPAEGTLDLDSPAIKALNLGIKENFVMKTHPYKITRQKTGRWKTYVRKATGGRRRMDPQDILYAVSETALQESRSIHYEQSCFPHEP